MNDDLKARTLKVLSLAEKASAGPWSAHDGQRIFKMPAGVDKRGRRRWRKETVCKCGIVTADNHDVAYAVGRDDEDHNLGEGVELHQKQHNAAFIAASHESAALLRELLAEVDALGKDARRYRRMRESGAFYDSAAHLMQLEELDSAIDAALSQGEPRG